MGACFPRKSIIYSVNTISKTPTPRRTITISKLELSIEEPFPDMPEIDSKYTGIGVKHMKAYKCDWDIEKLNELRQRFWTTKISKNERYNILKQALCLDSEKCKKYLEQNGFVILEGCVNKCTDNTNFIYTIPNYCVNEPYSAKNY